MSLLQKETETNFWISYSDLVAGLLFIFLAILLISHFSFAYQKEENKKVTEKLEEFLKLREKIANDLQSNFSKEGIEVEIDPKRGILTIKEKLLFDSNLAVLKPEGKDLLKIIIPLYTQTLFGNEEYKKWINNILIEGHASYESDARYLKDMKLSQDRAFSVLQFIFGDEFGDFVCKEDLKRKVTAQGKGYLDLLKRKEAESGREFVRRNRRVEIKYLLDSDRMLQELNELMKQNKNG